MWQSCVFKLDCDGWSVGCCIAEGVEPHCYKLCSYDGLNNTELEDLIECAFNFRQITFCATSTYIFSTIKVRTIRSGFGLLICKLICHCCPTFHEIKMSACMLITVFNKFSYAPQLNCEFLCYTRSLLGLKLKVSRLWQGLGTRKLGLGQGVAKWIRLHCWLCGCRRPWRDGVLCIKQCDWWLSGCMFW